VLWGWRQQLETDERPQAAVAAAAAAAGE
jgi:hypothetical protein